MNTIHIRPGCIDHAIKGASAEYVLDRGRYYTRGAWDWDDGSAAPELAMVRHQAVLRGAGPARTRIELLNPQTTIIGKAATYYQMLTGGGYRIPTQGTRIEDLHLDAEADRPVKALQIWGSQVQVRNVHVTGLNGARDVLEGEGFGILINNSALSRTHGSNVIDSCRVEVEPGAYACAVYMGTDGNLRPEDALAWSEVADTVAICPSSRESRAHCGFGINARTRITGCQSIGFERAIFSDTGAGDDVVIREFYASGCSIGLELRSSSPDWTRRRILVADSTFVCEGGLGGYVAGCVLVDEFEGKGQFPAPRLCDVRFERCTFVNASPDPGHCGSAAGRGCGPVEFTDCRWIGNWDFGQARAAGWKFYGSNVNRATL